MFGKTIPQPRRICYLADDAHLQYKYAKDPLPLTLMASSPSMQELKQRIEVFLGVPFNSVLCNQYRNGQDYMGFHSDDERELRGESGTASEVTIASISLGAERRFVFEPRGKVPDQGKEKIEYTLAHGSLLVMSGTTQTHWRHALPKMLRVKEERINLTFRMMYPKPLRRPGKQITENESL